MYRVVQKKVDNHAVWEHNLQKLLLNNSVILVECNSNKNNTNSNVYGAVIMAEPLREFIRFIRWM